jgi:hypothetical protein
MLEIHQPCPSRARARDPAELRQRGLRYSLRNRTRSPAGYDPSRPPAASWRPDRIATRARYVRQSTRQQYYPRSRAGLRVEYPQGLTAEESSAINTIRAPSVRCQTLSVPAAGPRRVTFRAPRCRPPLRSKRPRSRPANRHPIVCAEKPQPAHCAPPSSPITRPMARAIWRQRLVSRTNCLRPSAVSR